MNFVKSQERKQFEQLTAFLKACVSNGQIKEDLFYEGIRRNKEYLNHLIENSKGLPQVSSREIALALSTVSQINGVLIYQNMKDEKDTLVSVGKQMDSFLYADHKIEWTEILHFSDEYAELIHNLKVMDKSNLLATYCKDIDLPLADCKYIIYKFDNLESLVETHNENL